VPIERLPATTSPERVGEALARDGCAVVERLVPAVTLRAALEELAPWIDATPTGRDDFLSVPFEVARELPDELLRLIGYQRGAYALGYVDDVRDPLEALRGARSADSDAGRLGDLERAAAQLRGRR
jgi:hypothetical protein